MNLQYWIDTTECVCGSERPIEGCLHCDLISLQQRLNDLFRTIEATGGVLQSGEEFLGPVGEPEWFDLADAYIGLCTVLEREPVYTKEDE